jgi:hypothetical protein
MKATEVFALFAATKMTPMTDLERMGFAAAGCKALIGESTDGFIIIVDGDYIEVINDESDIVFGGTLRDLLLA